MQIRANHLYTSLRQYNLRPGFGYKAASVVTLIALAAALLSLIFGARVPTDIAFSRRGPIELNTYGKVDAVRTFPMRLRYDNDYKLVFDFKALENTSTNFRMCVVLRDDKTNPTDAFCYEDKDGEGHAATPEKQQGQFEFRTRSKTFTGEVYVLNQGNTRLEVGNIQILKIDRKVAAS